MDIWETFSKRQKRRERAGKQDVYQYDDLPAPFRMQVCHIWNTAIGIYYMPQGYSSASPSPANELWEFMHDTLARELGVGALAAGRGDPSERCTTFALNTETAGVIDLIELSCRAIDRGARQLTDRQKQNQWTWSGADSSRASAAICCVLATSNGVKHCFSCGSAQGFEMRGSLWP
jgi:hypothetical protein